MKYLNFNTLLSSQDGAVMGPDTRGGYWRVVEQTDNVNENTTRLGLVRVENE